jgi:saccharopepsin
VHGFISQDKMRIGDLVWERQDFGEAVYQSEKIADAFKFDGVFGLGHDAGAVNLAVPPLYNMIQQGLLADPIFSFYFSNVSVESDEAEVIFGGINHEHYSGNLVELSLRRKNNWEPHFNKIAFGKEIIELVDMGAAIDTGASMITLPLNVARQM